MKQGVFRCLVHWFLFLLTVYRHAAFGSLRGRENWENGKDILQIISGVSVFSYHKQWITLQRQKASRTDLQWKSYMKAAGILGQGLVVIAFLVKFFYRAVLYVEHRTISHFHTETCSLLFLESWVRLSLHFCTRNTLLSSKPMISNADPIIVTVPLPQGGLWWARKQTGMEFFVVPVKKTDLFFSLFS